MIKISVGKLYKKTAKTGHRTQSITLSFDFNMESSLKCEICEKKFSTKTTTLELFIEDSKILPKKSNEISIVLLAGTPTQV